MSPGSSRAGGRPSLVSEPPRPAAPGPAVRGRHRQAISGLPSPPDDAEKASYSDRGLPLITGSSLITFGALLVSQARFVTLSPVVTAIFLPFVLFTVAYYLLSLVVSAGTRGFDLAAHRRLVAAWRPPRYPSLDVFLPVCGEPIAVLRNTWRHVRELMEAYPGPAAAYVLDDGASPAVAAEAARFGFTCLVRPNRGWMRKAGNLRHGFAQSSGEFILLLDADFAPRRDLPAELLPYFSADPGLGIVQSPQFFRTSGEMSWMERGASAVQELFYRLIQVCLDRHDGAICVGTCGIYRRTALAVNGGTTPIEHSEDIHTGFDLKRAGWGLRYIPVPLATGLCPSSPDAFLAQQYRWCAGSVSLIGSRKFWRARLRWRTRCGYLAGFCYYLHTALFTFVAPAISLALLTLLPQRVELANYGFILPAILYNAIIFPAWHRCQFGPAAFMAKQLYGWAHLFALWDIARGSALAWQPTGSEHRPRGLRRVWAGVAGWTGTTSVAWAGLAAWRVTQYGAAFIPLLVLGLVACAMTAMMLASRRNHARLAAAAAP
jgi:cellulose synthase (UDP-forming)